MSSRVLTLAALLLLWTPAQPQTQAAPSFDVATIKLTDPSNEGHVGIHTNDTALTTIGTNARVLLQTAFDIPRDLIFNLPKWAEETRYDVTAKDSTVDPANPRKLSDEQQRAMLQALLTERFGLKYHTEMREVTAYELVYVHPSPAIRKVDKEVDSTNTHNEHMVAKGIGMARLAKKLGDELHRPVIDHTGLTGFYDVDLRWRSDDEAASAAAANDPNAPPTLLTAVQEQLGLKLRSGKQTVPVLIVDSLTPPTAN